MNEFVITSEQNENEMKIKIKINTSSNSFGASSINQLNKAL
jgi:hypothetical protein